MNKQASFARPVAIVLGCSDVGSAAALALHQAGFAVVLVDEADPSWHRRGMAFTNAWYVGNAELEGEGACFCASLKSIPSILARQMIAATTWSWPGVAATLDASVLVDARGRKRRGSEVLRGRLPLTIGIGPDFVGGEDVDVAMEYSEASSGRSAGGGTGGAERLHESPSAGSVGNASCAVGALRHGRFMTERRIGDTVSAGQIVGGLGNEVIRAPTDGVLLGLAARGARIEPGDTLVEVEPGGVAHRCYGVGDVSRRIAARLVATLAGRVDGDRVPRLQAAPLVALSLTR